MSRYPKVRNTSVQNNQTLFSNRVVRLVREGRALSECECEPLVREWIKSVPESTRPTVQGILMELKRELWGLTV